MMGTEPASRRRQFRAHPLDGAALYFQPATGVHVRVAHASTRHLRRRGPRVAMFGITNACNLACEFCSRALDRASEWTVASAAEVLRDLHDAGLLEVAYGGGEPFAFRGFAELVAELDATTTLAQHVTTNGTSIRAATWPRFAGRFGQVRLSIYDGVAWRGAAETLAGYRQLWGANLLVDGAALANLPRTLAELAARGCRDVSLLSYVGPEAHRHLDAGGAERLAAIIADSPIACRLSVCFGARVPAPRLHVGDEHADCGAGRDFVSITPDRRVQSCSFQDRSLPGATAGEILAAWRLQQPILAAPSPRRGCARTLPLVDDPPPPPPIAIWQSFSGNNSGECLLVASFETIAAAEAYLAELAPGWAPDGPYSAQWRELFVTEGVAAAAVDLGCDEEASPRELVAIGATVMAAQYAADDAFPELRALAWKRGAYVVPGGIHVHDDLTLLVAVRANGGDDRERLLASAWHPAARLHVHGDIVLVALPVLGDDRSLPTLAAARDEVVRCAGERRFAAELHFAAVTDAEVVAAKKHLGHRPAGRKRLWVSFWGGSSVSDGAAFARTLPGARTTVAGSSVLVDPAPDRKRLAVLAFRRGGTVRALDGARIQLTASVWFESRSRVVDVERLAAALRAELPPGSELTVEGPAHRQHHTGPRATIITDAPAAALAVLTRHVDALGARLNVWAADLDPLGATLRRLFAALGR